MNKNNNSTPHLFHIPVMGIAFTLDTPLRVARYGISSVISLVDDILIEQVREHYCKKLNLAYTPIANKDEDSRARRIEAYLNMMHDEIDRQFAALKASPFVVGSEITRYFNLLPDGELKAKYDKMLTEKDADKQTVLQSELRNLITTGHIDVNIMTKLDRLPLKNGEPQDQKQSDAMAALRGFAKSKVNGSMVFSAGLNRHLYSYLNEFPDFQPDENGNFKKRIILKVSDYRSTKIQGKFFAQRGLWVSEYRVESGLNCGGHAFGFNGLLMGPILQDFKDNHEVLKKMLLKSYTKALQKNDREVCQNLSFATTVQGGIGTVEEDALLRTRYNVSATGWGTPFLLVPEAVIIDDEHLDKLCQAHTEDIELSDVSPLMVKFWNLKKSASELIRKQRISEDKPGSPCFKRFCTLDDSLTGKPLCAASKEYIKVKLENLKNENWATKQFEYLKAKVLNKGCICNDLGGSAAKNFNLKSTAKTSVCCGPNIINFDKLQKSN